MTDPGNVPAVVLTCGRRAVVLHPDGSEHENAVLCRARLESRGFCVVPVPANVGPFLRGVPQLLHAQILELVAASATAA